MLEIYALYTKLRFLVGYLGEKSQFSWWQSSFLDPNSKPFLQPSFPRSWALAQYHGVVEAARKVHDDFIGVGRVYHLFRLPEEMEHKLHESFGEQMKATPMDDALASRDAALEALRIIANGAPSLGEGPMTLGSNLDLGQGEVVARLAGAYLSAFLNNSRCYPYFRLT